jgi:NAD(P)-dependent dehydrogenase (short-subunit alcohol dehydrogenase family)
MCSRSVSAGEKAIEDELMKDGEGGYCLTLEQKKLVSVKQLDLNSLASIKSFCDDINSESKLNIDYLICNAGIMAVQTREETVDGFEKQVGVNHFGHAYLVQQLYKKITTSAKDRDADVRIIILASSAHSMSSVRTEDLHYTNGRTYSAWGSYGQSKQCNVLYAKALEEKLRTDGFGTNVTAMSVHPGVIKTALWRNTAFSSNFIVSWFGDTFLMKKTIPQGASTTLFAALSPVTKSNDYRGAYCVDCNKEDPCVAARDYTLAQTLLKVTMKQLEEKTANL